MGLDDGNGRFGLLGFKRSELLFDEGDARIDEKVEAGIVDGLLPHIVALAASGQAGEYLDLFDR